MITLVHSRNSYAQETGKAPFFNYAITSFANKKAEIRMLAGLLYCFSDETSFLSLSLACSDSCNIAKVCLYQTTNEERDACGLVKSREMVLAREHAEVEAIADSSSLPEAVLQNSHDCEEQWSTTDEDCSAATCSCSPSPAPVSPTPADTEPPLYPGARISESMGLHLLHSLTLKHGLAHVALADLLKVVAYQQLTLSQRPTDLFIVFCVLQTCVHIPRRFTHSAVTVESSMRCPLSFKARTIRVHGSYNCDTTTLQVTKTNAAKKI